MADLYQQWKYSPITGMDESWDPVAMEEAAVHIIRMCGWNSTVEGSEFWEAIHTRLQRMSDEARKWKEAKKP